VWSRRFATHPARRSTRRAPLLELGGRAAMEPGRRAAMESIALGDYSAPVHDRRGWRWRGPAGLEEVAGPDGDAMEARAGPRVGEATGKSAMGAAPPQRRTTNRRPTNRALKGSRCRLGGE
jgi:hypothetical protein